MGGGFVVVGAVRLLVDATLEGSADATGDWGRGTSSGARCKGSEVIGDADGDAESSESEALECSASELTPATPCTTRSSCFSVTMTVFDAYEKYVKKPIADEVDGGSKRARQSDRRCRSLFL